MRMRWTYLNTPDKTDPDNSLRVFCVVVGRCYLKGWWHVDKLFSFRVAIGDITYRYFLPSRVYLKFFRKEGIIYQEDCVPGGPHHAPPSP